MALRRFGDVEVDTGNKMVRRGGAPLTLKPKELDLLLHFVSRPGVVITRQELIERVWGYSFVGRTRTVDVHVRWLRAKLEQDPERPLHFRTVRGVGYKFVP